MKALIRSAAALIIAATCTGCLTQRTVSEGGQTVSRNYVIKRPLKEAVRNSQD